MASNNYSTVGGGSGNMASAYISTVAGGQFSTATGYGSMVPGGYSNAAAGDYGFAAGYRAKINASHDGAFLWADQSNFDFNSAAANEFAARCTGGARFVTAIDGQGIPTNQLTLTSAGNLGVGIKNPLGALHVHAATDENFVSRDASIALGKPPGTFTGVSFQGVNDANTANKMLAFIGDPIVIAGGNVYIGHLAPASLPTQPLQVDNGAYCSAGGVWANASDRNLKENFSPLDENEILNRLDTVPIQKWNYKNERQAVHIGPVAQDFYAAYQLGDSDKSISTIDVDGIALAAIKALHKTIKELRTEITEQQEQSKQFKNENEKLQARLQDENGKLHERIAVLERIVKQLAVS